MADIDASVTVVRLWEAGCIAAWLLGVVLVARTARSPFFYGFYLGATALFAWDFIWGQPWFMNFKFHQATITLFTIEGQSEALWAPASYAAFFGITSILAVRYREWLDSRLGAWKLPALGAASGIADIVIEGLGTEGLGVYAFSMRSEWLIVGVPWLNIPVCAFTTMLMVYVLTASCDILERAGYRVYPGQRRTPRSYRDDHAPNTVADRRADDGPGSSALLTQPTGLTVRSLSSTGPFWLGLVIPGGVLYIATTVFILIFHWADPWPVVGATVR